MEKMMVKDELLSTLANYNSQNCMDKVLEKGKTAVKARKIYLQYALSHL